MSYIDEIKQEIKALRGIGVNVSKKAEAMAIKNAEECSYSSPTDVVDCAMVCYP